jgi:hypothetical protein
MAPIKPKINFWHAKNEEGEKESTLNQEGMWFTWERVSANKETNEPKVPFGKV